MVQGVLYQTMVSGSKLEVFRSAKRCEIPGGPDVALVTEIELPNPDPTLSPSIIARFKSQRLFSGDDFKLSDALL